MKNNTTIIIILIAVVFVGYFFFIKNPLVPEKTNTENNPSSAKIDINEVCDGALAYMSFPDGASAAQFVAECKEGKHPEVIEQYKAQMNLGDGANI